MPTELRSLLHKAASVTSGGGKHMVGSSPHTLQRLPTSLRGVKLSHPCPPPLPGYSDPVSRSLPLLICSYVFSLSAVLPTHGAHSDLRLFGLCSTWNIITLVSTTVSASRRSGLDSHHTSPKRTSSNWSHDRKYHTVLSVNVHPCLVLLLTPCLI